MVHLICTSHGVRTRVAPVPTPDLTVELAAAAFHNKDGKRCDTSTVKIGVKEYPVAFPLMAR